MGGAVSGPGYACLVDLILRRLRDDKAALSAALQLVWWAAMFLLLPWTAFVVPVLGGVVHPFCGAAHHLSRPGR